MSNFTENREHMHIHHCISCFPIFYMPVYKIFVDEGKILDPNNICNVMLYSAYVESDICRVFIT